MVRVIEGKTIYRENDLKGNENCFESGRVIEGSSYGRVNGTVNV